MQVKHLFLGLSLVAILASCKKEEAAPASKSTMLYGITSVPSNVDGSFFLEVQEGNSSDTFSLSFSGQAKLNSSQVDIGTVNFGPKALTFSAPTFYNTFNTLVSKNSQTANDLVNKNLTISFNDANFGNVATSIKTVSDFKVVFPDYPEHNISQNSDLTLSWTPDSDSVDFGIYVYSSGLVSNKSSDPLIDSTVRFSKLYANLEDDGSFTIPASTWNSWPKNSIINIYVAKASIYTVGTSKGKLVNLGSYIFNEGSYILK